MRAFIKPILLAVLLITVCKVFEPLSASARDGATSYAMTPPDGTEMPSQEDDSQDDDDVAFASPGFLNTPTTQKTTAPEIATWLKELIEEIISPPPQA